MRKQSLRARDYVDHMLIALDRIQAYLKEKSEHDFQSSSLLQDAVIRNLENLGEAAKNLKQALPDIQTRFPNIPFDVLYATRNQLAHGYYFVDLAIVWKVTRHELPNLQQQLQHLLTSAPNAFDE